MPNEPQTMPTAEEIGAATARAALYAAGDEATRILETFPPRLREQAPSPEKVSGKERLAWARRNMAAAERTNAAKAKAEEASARNEAIREEQRAKNVRRGETAAHYREWMQSAAAKSGAKYEPLHADCADLTHSQMMNWKDPAPRVETAKKAALGFL